MTVLLGWVYGWYGKDADSEILKEIQNPESEVFA